MDAAVRAKLRPLLEASKRGRILSTEESDFCAECWKKWPTQYAEVHAEMVENVTASINPLYRKQS